MGCCKSKPTDAQREQHRKQQQQQQQQQQQNRGQGSQNNNNNNANRGQGSQGKPQGPGGKQQVRNGDRDNNARGDAEPKRTSSAEVRKPAPNRRGKGRGPAGRGERLDEIRKGRDNLDGGYSDESFERREGRGSAKRNSPRRDLAPRRSADRDYEYYYDDDDNNNNNNNNNNRNNNSSNRKNNDSSTGGFLSSFFGGGEDDYYSYGEDGSGSDVARDIAYADRLRRDRDYTQAEQMYARCIARLDIRDESDYGDEPADPALLPRCLESLADLWADQAEADRDRDRLDDALNYYLRAAKILDNQRGARPLAGAPPRLKAANIQMRIGDKRNAERTYQEVLSQVKRGKNLTPEEEGLEGEALAGLAKASASKGGARDTGGRGGRGGRGGGGGGGGGRGGESAMEIQLKAVEVVRNTYGTGHDKYATAVHELATLELKDKKYESALEHFETAAEIRSAAFGEDNEKTAESRGGMGMALLKLGEKGEAMDLLGEAMSVYDQAYGFDHPMTRMFREAMQSAAR